jgi:hypothetical protein
MNRNNTNEMLPDNSTGKGDGAVKRTQNTPIAIAKQGEEPDDHERTTTETLECTGTDKLDPTIGSTGKTQQDRNLAVDAEPILMKSSTSKLNRDEHPIRPTWIKRSTAILNRPTKTEKARRYKDALRTTS